MAYNRQQSISKPLIIALVVVAAIAAIWYATRSMGAGKEETATYGPKPPDNMVIAPVNPRAPRPVDASGGTK